MMSPGFSAQSFCATRTGATATTGSRGNEGQFAQGLVDHLGALVSRHRQAQAVAAHTFGLGDRCEACLGLRTYRDALTER